MICPDCRRHFSADERAVCPYCGLTIATGVVKSSAILIGANGRHDVYRTVEEVPEELRSRLVKTTSSPQARTIIIADRRLKDRLRRHAASHARRQVRRAAPGPLMPRQPAGTWALWLGLAVLSGASIVLLTASLLR